MSSTTPPDEQDLRDGDPCASTEPAMPPRFSMATGWLLAAAVALLAYGMEHLPFPPFRITEETGGTRAPLNAALLAIVIGVLIRNGLRLPPSVGFGCRSIVRHVIPLAIVFVGAGLDFAVLRGVGMRSLFIILACIVLALGAAYVIGIIFGLPKRTAVLLGTGTAICGSSAIVAVAPLIRADSRDIVLSISTVYLVGLGFMLAMPAVGTAIGMAPQAYGVWTGTSIHAVPQAVAAGFAVAGAGEMATLVKLVRVAMLAPLAIAIALFAANGRGGLRTVRLTQLIPWFIWGFLIMAAINTAARLPDLMNPDFAGALRNGFGWLKDGGTALLTLSMAAIGLEVDLREMARAGSKALLACALASIILAAGSYVLIAIVL